MAGHERPALVTPTSWLRLHGEPTFVLQRGGAQGDGIWIRGPGRAVVRASASPDAPVVGRVVPSWDDNSIRLLIEPTDGPPIRSDVFAREDIGAGPSTLTRIVQLSTDVNGTYRATLRSPRGEPVGWLEVRVGLHQPAPVMYEAVWPPGMDEGLSAAATAALGEEIDWIEREAYDVYSMTQPTR